MEIGAILGLAATLVIIVVFAVWSGKNNKGGETKNSWPVVAGVIMGTVVGGSATVGTSQLAYNYGMSAVWFTLGSGIACLIMGILYVGPLRRSGCATLAGMINKEFGGKAGMAASILSAIGTFINIISQLISATAVIAVVAPNLGIVPAVAIAALFMVLYVVFGGTKGAGMVGIVKMLLLYVSMISCGALVLMKVGGFGSFVDMVHAIDNPEGVNFFSVFARGFGVDAGAGLSLILGVLTTQTYAQAVMSGKTNRSGRAGALVSAFLIPPIGLCGVLVGLYMRANAALFPGLTAKTALTTFITSNMPPVVAGVMLGALFVAVLGTGAGLALGISTTLNNDIVKRVTRKFDDPKKLAMLSKVWIVVVLAAACLLSTGKLGDVILQFSYMSMGLRGAVVFAPLVCALWLPGRVDRRFALAAIIAGPLLVLIFGLLDVLSFDPLFIGILAALVIVAAGYVVQRNKHQLEK